MKELIDFILYEVKYLELEKAKGYFLVKRKWVWWILLFPVIIPLRILRVAVLTIMESILEINDVTYHWIEMEQQALTKDQKKEIRRRLSS